MQQLWECDVLLVNAILVWLGFCWRTWSKCYRPRSPPGIWPVRRVGVCEDPCWERLWLCTIYSQVVFMFTYSFLVRKLSIWQIPFWSTGKTHFIKNIRSGFLFKVFFFYHFFRACAEEAIQKLHGTVIGQQSVRLSWGRSPANKQVLFIRNHLELDSFHFHLF
jgi:hypothetical protein